MVEPGDPPPCVLPGTCWVFERPIVTVVSAASVPAMTVMTKRKFSPRVLGKERIDVRVLDDPRGPRRLAAKPGCLLSRASSRSKLAIERFPALVQRCRNGLDATIRPSEALAHVLQVTLDASNFSPLGRDQQPHHPARPRPRRIGACGMELRLRAAYILFSALDVARLDGAVVERVVEGSERFAFVEHVAIDASPLFAPAHAAGPSGRDLRQRLGRAQTVAVAKVVSVLQLFLVALVHS